MMLPMEFLRSKRITLSRPSKLRTYFSNHKMFVRMLTVHCDQNDSYEITMNVCEAREISKIRNMIFGLPPSSTLRPKLGWSPST